jgi:hypothetical protein
VPSRPDRSPVGRCLGVASVALVVVGCVGYVVCVGRVGGAGNRCVSWIAGGDHTSGPVTCASLSWRRVALVVVALDAIRRKVRISTSVVAKRRPCAMATAQARPSRPRAIAPIRLLVAVATAACPGSWVVTTRPDRSPVGCCVGVASRWLLLVASVALIASVALATGARPRL